MTYNHAPYIKDALDGFAMQRTTMPVVTCIVDDASTDGEIEIINNYLHDHFDLDDKSIVRDEETENFYLKFARHKENINCYFAVLFLKDNHYSDPEKRKLRFEYISEWTNSAKYLAVCEGDDYWIDPLKLQKQYEYLEAHPEYSMITHQTTYVDENKNIRGNYLMWYEDCDIITIDEMLTVPHTSSYFYISIFNDHYKTKEIIDKYKYKKGMDKSLFLFLFSIGKVRYLKDNMSCYRKIFNGGNWCSRVQKNNLTCTFVELETDMIEQINYYGLDLNINKHYYRNVVWYSLRFFILHPSFENLRLHLYGWSKAPDKYACLLYIIKKSYSSFIKSIN